MSITGIRGTRSSLLQPPRVQSIFGEEFVCKREITNKFDPFAVAVLRGITVIGHLPRKISSICYLFLHQEGSIIQQITSYRHYSDDLVQGRLQIPCILRFKGTDKVTAKAKKLVKSALSTKSVDLLASKLRKVTDTLTVLSHARMPPRLQY